MFLFSRYTWTFLGPLRNNHWGRGAALHPKGCTLDSLLMVAVIFGTLFHKLQIFISIWIFTGCSKYKILCLRSCTHIKNPINKIFQFYTYQDKQKYHIWGNKWKELLPIPGVFGNINTWDNLLKNSIACDKLFPYTCYSQGQSRTVMMHHLKYM